MGDLVPFALSATIFVWVLKIEQTSLRVGILWYGILQLKCVSDFR